MESFRTGHLAGGDRRTIDPGKGGRQAVAGRQVPRDPDRPPRYRIDNLPIISRWWW